MEILKLALGVAILRVKQVDRGRGQDLIRPDRREVRVKELDLEILRDLKAAPAVEDADKFSGIKFLGG